MTSQVVSLLCPAPRELWAELAAQDANTLVFQTPTWTDSLCASGSYQDQSLFVELRDGRKLVFPLVRTKASLPWFSSLASMPDGWGMGGFVARDPIQPAEIDEVLGYLSRVPALRVTIRPNPLTRFAWPANPTSGFHRMDRLTHIVDLKGGFDQVWSKRFPSATRNKLRKAEKYGLDIVRGVGGEHLDEFYKLYLDWLARRARERSMPLPIAQWLGKRREPLLKFKVAAQMLGSAFQVWLACKDGQPIAAAILLHYNNQAFYWRGASARELAGPARANEYLQFQMIQEACKMGCRYYHMGESGGVQTLMYFKKRLGGEEHLYPGFYRERLPVTPLQQSLHTIIRQLERQKLRET